MVLKRREENLIPRPQMGPTPSLRDEVNAFRGAAHKDATTGVFQAKETGDDLTRALEGLGGFFAEQVDAAVDVGITLRVIVDQGLDDDLRLL
jgi:hypothetical protein